MNIPKETRWSAKHHIFALPPKGNFIYLSVSSLAKLCWHNCTNLDQRRDNIFIFAIHGGVETGSIK